MKNWTENGYLCRSAFRAVLHGTKVGTGEVIAERSSAWGCSPQVYMLALWCGCSQYNFLKQEAQVNFARPHALNNVALVSASLRVDQPKVHHAPCVRHATTFNICVGTSKPIECPHLHSVANWLEVRLHFILRLDSARACRRSCSVAER